VAVVAVVATVTTVVIASPTSGLHRRVPSTDPTACPRVTSRDAAGAPTMSQADGQAVPEDRQPVPEEETCDAFEAEGLW
jgi:hypothetical protein